MDRVQETISGFSVKGSWKDIVEYGEELSGILRGEDVEREAFEHWEDWRPKSGETFEDEIAKKTAEKASLEAGEGEGLVETWRKAFRGFEEQVYRNVMGLMGPPYFDSDLMSAKLEKLKSEEGRDRFLLEVDFHEPGLKDRVRSALPLED